MFSLQKYSTEFFKKIDTETSLKARKIDFRCLTVAMNQFLSSGTKEDAFDVYFCFCEIFKVFGEGYKKNTRTLLELMTQYEHNTGVLVEKHRDHYSHSVYVFCIGLSIYESNSNFQTIFQNHVKKRYSEKDTLHTEFLYQWGLAALFHDIGYPFEMVFMQIQNYNIQLSNESETFHKLNQTAQDKIKDKLFPRVTYTAVNEFVSDEATKKYFGTTDIRKIIADEIFENIGFPKEWFLTPQIIEKALSGIVGCDPKYLDHGFFGAIVLFKKLIQNCESKTDALIAAEVATSVLCHNSFLKYKFTELCEISGEDFKTFKLSPQTVPITYLLMLCDELQAWGRAGFGLYNKEAPLAYTCFFDLENSSLKLKYIFDNTVSYKKYAPKINGKKEKIRNFYNLDIFREIAVLTQNLPHQRAGQNSSLSISHFKNIVEIAIAINDEFYVEAKNKGWDTAIGKWDSENMTLEYKMSNILQAKSYAEKLAKIGCFYDDRKLNYKVVKKFTKKEVEKLAMLEHIRWCNEKISMGWKRGTNCTDKSGEINYYKDRAEREEKRVHKDLVPFDELGDDAGYKDRMIKNMVKFLREMCGINIYRVNSIPEKVHFTVGVVGSRTISDKDYGKVLNAVMNHLASLKNKYQSVELITGMAAGADTLVAETAKELGIQIRVVLPFSEKDFIEKQRESERENLSLEKINHKMFSDICNYADKTVVVPQILIDSNNKSLPYGNQSNYLLNQCDEIIAIVKGVGDNGDGGTIQTIEMAKTIERPIKIWYI